jgi:TonB-linked SusC/RagA family outer membrane protein
MKKSNLGVFFLWKKSPKFNLKMKLTTFLLIISLLKVQANTYSQNTKISLDVENATVEEIFTEIESLSEFKFLYNHRKINLDRKMSVKAENKKISNILKQLFVDTNVSYVVKNKQIILKTKELKIAPVLEKPVQEISISGTVVDDTGGPLPGANVKIKGTKTGTTTDFDGNFTIEVPNKDAVIVFSYIGFKTQEIAVADQTTINVKLEASASSLDEVVVIGYGSVAKKDLTGAVGVVDNIGERPITSAEEGLQGSVSGVTVVSNGGDPTSKPNIQIRGVGTINDESPLWVVDGVPYYGGPINPFDIASMSILKDASSQAIYGVKASGGVILVTTKKGKNGKLSFDFNSFLGVQNVEKPKALNASDRAKYLGIAGFDTSAYDTTTRTNWVDEIFRTGIIKNYDIGVRGGNEKFNFSSSIGYNTKEGTVLNTSAERVTFRLNTSFRVNDKLKIGENISYSRTSGNSAFTGTTDENGGQSYNGVIAQAIKTDPSISVRDADGNYSDLPIATIHPVSSLERLDIEDINQDLFANLYVDYTIVDGLQFKSSFGINSKTRNFEEFKPRNPEFSKTGGPTSQNSLDYLTSDQKDWSLETTLTYATSFDDVHNLTLLAGHTIQRFQQDVFEISGSRFSSELENLREIINASQWTKPLNRYESNSLMSYFGRAIYAYDGKYILTASIRTDGTSKIPSEVSNNTWGTFPAVALAWTASNENFLKDNESITNLKFRASWGIIGNINSLDNYPTDIKLSTIKTILGSNDDDFENGLALNGRSNDDIKWELTESINFGADLSMFNNSLLFSADYFVKDTKDMILRLRGSSLEGINLFPNINAGGVQNKGYEASLAYQKNHGDFTYKISGNVSRIKNKVVSLLNDAPIPHTEYNVASHIPLVSAIGESLFSYYVLETDGVFQSDAEADAYEKEGDKIQPNAEAGDLKFVDQNNDGKISDDDKVFKGSAFPDFTYNINADFNYKNFDLRIFFQGVSGSSAYNGFKLTTVYPAQTSVGPEANLSADAIDTWHPGNMGSSNFKLSEGDANGNLRESDFWIEDTSYLRLKNVTLGYTFSNIKGIDRLRIYAAGENLFTATSYSGLDPEVGNKGIDGGQYPVATTFTLGVNFGF